MMNDATCKNLRDLANLYISQLTWGQYESIAQRGVNSHELALAHPEVSYHGIQYMAGYIDAKVGYEPTND